MEIDEVFKHIGELGSYQIKMLSALLFTSQMTVAFQLIQNVYVAAEPKNFTCVYHINGETLKHQGCANTSMHETCDYYENHERYTSIASKFNLYCGESYIASLVQSVFMTGVLVGALVFGQLSDRLGRLKALFVATAVLFVFAFVGAFASDIEFYTALRFFTGIGTQGIGLVVFVQLNEMVGPTKRVPVTVVSNLLFTAGILMLSLLAYVQPHWRYMELIMLIPPALLSVFYWILPESPRWLHAKGYVEEAEGILKMIAQQNGSDFPLENIKLKKPDNETTASKGSVIDLFRIKRLRWRTIIQIYLWFANCAVYYGLTMGAGDLGGDLYLNVVLLGLVEIPGFIIALFILDRFGRRYFVCGFMVVGGISCMAILIIPHHFTVPITALALIGKLSIASSFAALYLYTTELYPTVVRNVALGICAMIGRVGAIVAPVIIPMGEIYPDLQFLVFGALSFTAGLLTLGLPETVGKPLPETLEDLETEKTSAVPINDSFEDERTSLLNANSNADLSESYKSIYA